MCYPPSGYIIFSLGKLELYGGQGLDLKVGGRITCPFVVRKQLTYLSEAVTRKRSLIYIETSCMALSETNLEPGRTSMMKLAFKP